MSEEYASEDVIEVDTHDTVEETDETVETQETDDQRGEENTEETSEQETDEDLLGEESLDKKVRVKVDGEEKIMTVRELQKVKQLEAASYKKMQEAAETKKMAKGLIDLMENDFEQFLRVAHRGDNSKVTQIAERILENHLNEMSMSEPERKARRLEQENKSLKQRQEEWEQKQAQEAEDAEVKRQYDRLQTEVDGAVGVAGLPDTQMFKVGIAQTMIADQREKMQEAISRGQDPSQIDPAEYLTAEQAAHKVKENFLAGARDFFEQMSGEDILENLGSQIAGKIRKAKVKSVSSRTTPQFSKPSPGKPASKKQKNDEQSYQDWLDSLMM